MLEQLDGSDSPIGKPERKYPYPEGTKFANKIIVKQTILSEADKAGAVWTRFVGFTLTT